MRSTPELDRKLRLRLIEAVERAANGNADLFGRQLGYTNGGYIREIVRNVKPVRESLIARVHAMDGFAGWFDGLLPALVASDLARGAGPPGFDGKFSLAAIELAQRFDEVPAERRRALYALLLDEIRRASTDRPPAPDELPMLSRRPATRKAHDKSRA